jgi:hypothetical protein
MADLTVAKNIRKKKADTMESSHSQGSAEKDRTPIPPSMQNHWRRGLRPRESYQKYAASVVLFSVSAFFFPATLESIRR